MEDESTVVITHEPTIPGYINYNYVPPIFKIQNMYDETPLNIYNFFAWVIDLIQQTLIHWGKSKEVRV